MQYTAQQCDVLAPAAVRRPAASRVLEQRRAQSNASGLGVPGFGIELVFLARF